MSKILIETYRGFDIKFNTDSVKFECILGESNDNRSSIAFPSIKKMIDEFLKQNNDFKSFRVVPHPKSMWKTQGATILGIRKDGRLTAENDGGKFQLSNYDMEQYIIYKEEDDYKYEKLKELTNKDKLQSQQINKEKEEIISSMNLIRLDVYIKSLL